MTCFGNSRDVPVVADRGIVYVTAMIFTSSPCSSRMRKPPIARAWTSVAAPPAPARERGHRSDRRLPRRFGGRSRSSPDSERPSRARGRPAAGPCACRARTSFLAALRDLDDHREDLECLVGRNRYVVPRMRHGLRDLHEEGWAVGATGLAGSGRTLVAPVRRGLIRRGKARRLCKLDGPPVPWPRERHRLRHACRGVFARRRCSADR